MENTYRWVVASSSFFNASLGFTAIFGGAERGQILAYSFCPRCDVQRAA
jgi:hypothetical protein